MKAIHVSRIREYASRNATDYAKRIPVDITKDMSIYLSLSMAQLKNFRKLSSDKHEKKYWDLVIKTKKERTND